MVKAITPRTEFDYIAKEDRADDADPNFVVKWRLRALTSAEMAKMEDSTQSADPKTGRVDLNQGTVRIEGARACIVGWENFKDGEGNEIPFETEMTEMTVLGKKRKPVRRVLLERIPYALLGELVDAATKGSRLEDDEGKD